MADQTVPAPVLPAKASPFEPVPNPRPAVRKIRAYAFDPQSSADLDTAGVNDSIIILPWEQPWEHPLTPGPCGEYIEVIDHDPASGLFYEPVDLNNPDLLAQNGLPPSEGRPQFHQQMVFAVAMKTIRNFERALGRKIYWSREIPAKGEGEKTYELRLRLRIYPHAVRDKNAFYSPEKTAILFGYFRPPNEQTSDRWVFTCLSQDIIAHETTHALLHGVHRRSIQPSNFDTLAFHEGFADIVALLQHFTMADVLRQQIAHNRGDLRESSLLSGLAGQFGQAVGRKGGALRLALDMVREERLAQQDPDEKKRAERIAATRLSDQDHEPHRRGGFLVAAVFDAFATIYERRTADLVRLAQEGNHNRGADLPPDLVNRLAKEASKTADHVLRMCVRALDYVPPVDMTFGEYLRAILTADADLVPDDPMGYRIAFAQAFRRRGIVPPDSLSMSPDSLMWETPDPTELPPDAAHGLFRSLLGKLKYNVDVSEKLAGNAPINFRELSIEAVRYNLETVKAWLDEESDEDETWERLLGVRMRRTGKLHPGEEPLGSLRWKDLGGGDASPYVQVYSARVARRSGPDGQELNQLVIQLVQKRRGYFDEKKQAKADAAKPGDPIDPPDFWFRGGSTLLVDLRDGQLRYTIRKAVVSDTDARLARQRAFEKERRGIMPFQMYEQTGLLDEREPFAMIHRS